MTVTRRAAPVVRLLRLAILNKSFPQREIYRGEELSLRIG